MVQHSITVLLFEDDESQAVLTREALEQEGFQVDVCANAQDGLRCAVAKVYQAYLIDIKLPDIPGVEVLRRLQALRPSALSIIVTAHGDEMAAVEAMKLGAYDYVVKSPNLSHLSALPMIIREGIAHHQLKDEREALRSEVWEYSRLLAERNAELRRVSRELKRFDALRSDLISMLTHDLRNPLTTIKEFVGILADGLAGTVSSTQHNYLKIIENNVLRLADMVRELLLLTRIEGGYVPLKRNFMRVETLLKPLADAMRPLAEAKQLQLILKLPAQTHALFVDEQKMRDVFSNLIDNAIKYTPGPGRVTITLKEEERSFLFCVEDTGQGIQPEELEKIFRPQGHRGAPEEESSLSISLALSQRLVELHGGRIWAESQSGEGSRFYLVLPKYTPEEVFRETVRSTLDQAKVSATQCSLIAFSVANAAHYLHMGQTDQLTEVLKALEQKLAIANQQRSADTVIYWRQGHMVVVIAAESHEGAARIAERLSGVLHAEPLLMGDGRRVETAYVVATVIYPDEADALEPLLALLLRKFGKPWDQRKRRILVIGDSREVSDGIMCQLDAGACEIIHRYQVSESLNQFESQVVDLIILDHTLSHDFREHLKQAFQRSPITQQIPVLCQDDGTESGLMQLVEEVRKLLKES
jgi:signal transduction histidine kinase